MLPTTPLTRFLYSFLPLTSFLVSGYYHLVDFIIVAYRPISRSHLLGFNRT